MNATALVCWFFFYHPPTFGMKHARQQKIEFIKHFDYVGTFLVILGLLLFFMGLSWGGQLHPWSSAYVIATIVVGAVLLIVFGFYEAFVPMREALLPTHVTTHRDFMFAVTIWSLGSAIYCKLPFSDDRPFFLLHKLTGRRLCYYLADNACHALRRLSCRRSDVAWLRGTCSQRRYLLR